MEIQSDLVADLSSQLSPASMQVEFSFPTSSTFKNWRTLTRPHGGGGTDPTCVADYLREKKIKPDATIVLTDGEVMGWGNWDHPVLWGIHNNYNDIVAPVGKTIKLERRV